MLVAVIGLGLTACRGTEEGQCTPQAARQSRTLKDRSSAEQHLIVLDWYEVIFAELLACDGVPAGVLHAHNEMRQVHDFRRSSEHGHRAAFAPQLPFRSAASQRGGHFL